MSNLLLHDVNTDNGKRINRKLEKLKRNDGYFCCCRQCRRRRRHCWWQCRTVPSRGVPCLDAAYKRSHFIDAIRRRLFARIIVPTLRVEFLSQHENTRKILSVRSEKCTRPNVYIYMHAYIAWSGCSALRARFMRRSNCVTFQIRVSVCGWRVVYTVHTVNARCA